MNGHFCGILVLVACILFLVPSNAYAYIDLGLAGRLFQLFYLVFFSTLMIVATPMLFFWKRIRGWAKSNWKLIVFVAVSVLIAFTSLMFFLG